MKQKKFTCIKENNMEKELLNEIDACLSNRYIVLEGDDDTLYVKNRENGEHFAIKVQHLED